MPQAERNLNDWTNGLMADVLAAGNILLGFFLIFGAPSRTAGVSFDYVHKLGPIWFWGAFFILAGTTSLIGQYLPLRLFIHTGHGLAATMCFFFTICFVIGVEKNINASLTGIAAYGTLGALHTVLAVIAVPRR